MASASISAQAASEIGASSRSRWFISAPGGERDSGLRRRLPMPRLPSAGRGGAAAAAVLGLDLDRQDRAGGEQVGAQVLVELGVVAAEPLQRHRRVLLLLVAVVGEDGGELGVVGGVDALVVPVDRLQLLHDRHDRPMVVDRRRTELAVVLVQPFTGHRARAPSGVGGHIVGGASPCGANAGPQLPVARRTNTSRCILPIALRGTSSIRSQRRGRLYVDQPVGRPRRAAWRRRSRRRRTR